MSDVKWIKICTDIFDDEKILLIEDMPERDAIIVIWFKLLCMAGKQNNDGIFIMNDKIAYTDEMLAAIFRRPLNTVRLALATFEQYGMVEIINDTIVIPNWEKHQNLEALRKKRDAGRKRVAAYRERQKAIADAAGNEALLGHALPPRGESEEIVLGDGDSYEGVVENTIPSYYGCVDTVENTIPPYEESMETPAQGAVTRYSTVTNAHVTPLDVDVDEEKEHLSTSKAEMTDRDGVAGGRGTPTLDDVAAFFETEGISVDPFRFWKVNRDRGWATKNGRPIDDWRQLARVWDSHEKPAAPGAAAGKRKAPEPVPSVEGVMSKYSCGPEEAETLIREGLY